ncbi:MAG TPA: single-stranded DNA-binding protein [Chloroflexota bacterium]|nr:single-stranded DNA-binding protein [Chloroflexota bacterium]
MAGSLNKVMLIGNVGRDPEMRYTQSGEPVTTFSLATNRRTQRDGQWVDEPDWHNIVAWGKLAEQCNEYLNKGRKIYIEGRLQTRSFDNKEGVKQYRTEIVAHTMLMLDQRPREGMEGGDTGGDFAEYRQSGGDFRGGRESGQRPSRPERAMASVGADDNTIDLDDTPF